MLGEDRDVAGQRRPGRRRRTRPRGAPARRSPRRRSTGAGGGAGRGRPGRAGRRGPRASAGRPRFGQHRDLVQVGEVLLFAVVDGGLVGLDGDHVARPTRSARAAADEPQTRSRGRRQPAPPAAVPGPSSTAGDQGGSAAPGWTCRGTEEPVTWNVAPGRLLVQAHRRAVGERAAVAVSTSRSCSPFVVTIATSTPVTPGHVGAGHARPVDAGCAIRQSSTGTTSWERCLPQARRRRRRRPPTARGCASRGRRTSPGTSSTATSDVEPGQPASAARPRPRP